MCTKTNEVIVKMQKKVWGGGRGPMRGWELVGGGEQGCGSR